MPIPRKTDEQKKIEGTFRKDRAFAGSTVDQPDIISSTPPAPDRFNQWAAEHWENLADELRKKNVLTGFDLGVFEAMCEQWGIYRHAGVQVEDLGAVVSAANGTLMQNPWVTIQNVALTNYFKMAREFGFTPASRGKVPKGKGETKSALDHLLAGLKPS